MIIFYDRGGNQHKPMVAIHLGSLLNVIIKKSNSRAESSGRGQGLRSNACIRAFPERSGGIRDVRRETERMP